MKPAAPISSAMRLPCKCLHERCCHVCNDEEWVLTSSKLTGTSLFSASLWRQALLSSLSPESKSSLVPARIIGVPGT